ncbi:hypothetical protein Y1Q_0008500 [Alligator mississippiensis]|uniref:Uncharacterized protein n=1 Tax=Alligator mississippiensis TaxID=8496 RepID=A0A151M1H9_ALLMI|nr:hypothetical protein Y1Q_0008500 [Alligator mississippiensis]
MLKSQIPAGNHLHSSHVLEVSPLIHSPPGNPWPSVAPIPFRKAQHLSWLDQWKPNFVYLVGDSLMSSPVKINLQCSKLKLLCLVMFGQAKSRLDGCINISGVDTEILWKFPFQGYIG